MPTITFVVRYKDQNGTGISVDNDITALIYEDSGETLKETRTIGTDENTTIVQLTDNDGVFYRTVVDVTDYLAAPVKIRWEANLAGAPLPPVEEIKSYPVVEKLTITALKKQVLSFLGYPAVGVELDNTHFNSIVERTITQYNRLIGIRTKKDIILVPNQYKYPIEDAGDRGVYRMEFLRKMGTPLVSDPLFGREYPRGQQLDFDQYVLGIAHWKNILRVTSQEPEWYWDPFEKVIVITLGNQDFTGVNEWIATAYYFKNVTLEDIPSEHHRLIFDYATALAKQVLSKIRGKYSGAIPSPGGNLTMDAEKLAAEAKEELEKLDQTFASIGMAQVYLTYG